MFSSLVSFRLAGLEPIVATVREFDLLIGPLDDWCTSTREKYSQLEPLQLTVEALQVQKEEVVEIRVEIDAHQETVEKAQELAEQFFDNTEVSCSWSGIQSVELLLVQYLSQSHAQSIDHDNCLDTCTQ